MAIEIKQDQGSQLLSQAISDIPRYMQLGEQKKTQDLTNQIALMQALQGQQQYQQQNQEYRKANYMDAKGYDNPQIMEWIQQMQLQQGQFVPDATNQSGFTWTGTNVLSTKDDVWAEYKMRVGGTNNQQDWDYFDKVLWPGVLQSRHSSSQSAIRTLENQGYAPRDVRWIMANNPVFDRSIQNLEASLQGQEKDLYKNYIPGKEMSMTQRWTEGAPWIGGGIMAGAYGLGKLTTPSAEVLKDVTEKFDSDVLKWDSKVNKAQDAINKANKIKAKTDSSKKAKKTKIKNAKKNLTKVKGQRTRDIKKLKTVAKKTITESKPWNKWKLGSPGVRTGAALLAPFALRQAGQKLGGDRGEAMGGAMAGGLELTSGTMSGASAYKRILQMMAKNTAKRGAVGLGMAAADSPFLPFGDIAAMGLMLYGGASDIKEAYRMWQEDKARRKSRKPQ